MEGVGDLANHTVHIDEGQQGAIHQYAGDHRDDRWDRQHVVGHVEPVNRFCRDDTDHEATHEGADDRSVTQFEIDEVTCTDGYNGAQGDEAQQAGLYVEDGREAYGSDGGGDGIDIIRIVRHHAQLTELMVDQDVVHHQDTEREGDTEGHRSHDHDRIGRTDDTYLQVIVDHVVDEVDQRHARHDKQGTGQQWVIRRIRQCRERGGVGQAGRYECGDRHAYVMVDAPLHAVSPCLETAERANGGIEEGDPVATEQLTETAAGKSGADGHHEGLIASRLVGDLLELFLETIDGIILLDRPPGETADLRKGGHVNAMFLAFLELGEGVGLVADVDHDHGPADVEVQFVLGDSQKSGDPFHVPVDAVGVGRALDQ